MPAREAKGQKQKQKPISPECEAVGALMRLARNRTGLSLEKVGARMKVRSRTKGTSKGYLSEIERGLKWCRLDVFLAYKDALGYPASAILTDVSPALIAGLVAVRAAVGQSPLHQFSDMDAGEIKLFFERGWEAVHARRLRHL